MLAVLASPNPLGGPWACLGGARDDDRCGANAEGASSFTWSWTYAPRQYLFFAVMPDVVARPAPSFQLRITNSAGPAGSWADPFVVPGTPLLGSKYISQELTPAVRGRGCAPGAGSAGVVPPRAGGGMLARPQTGGP